MLRSAAKDNLRFRDKGISGLNHTPHATAVYASCSALLPPHATLASRRLAGPYLGRTCTGRSRQLRWRLPFAHPTRSGHPGAASQTKLRLEQLVHWLPVGLAAG